MPLVIFISICLLFSNTRDKTKAESSNDARSSVQRNEEQKSPKVATFKIPTPVKDKQPSKMTISPEKTISKSSSTVPKVDPMKESYPDKIRRMTAIATKIKRYLEPSFNQSRITKVEYKTIMRKCVEKVYQESKITPVRDESMKKLVTKYIEHYIKHRSS